jgi:hypothetical protein
MDIKYNQPIEVIKNQYYFVMEKFAGIVAGQIKENKYFIKVWRMKYKEHIEKALTIAI